MNSIDAESILNEVVEVSEVSEEHKQIVSVCSETLSKLGYEIINKNSEEVDLAVRFGDSSYTLIIISDEETDDYFSIPVGNSGYLGVNIFKTKADYIAFYHGNYIYQFKTSDLCSILHPLVMNLKKEQRIAYSTRKSAIKLKRLHARYNFDCDCDAYDIMLYAPIQTLCKRLEYTKQQVK